MQFVISIFSNTDGNIPAFQGGFDFFFQICGKLTNRRDPQVYRALFCAKSLKGGELSGFFGDLSVDDVFRVAFFQ